MSEAVRRTEHADDVGDVLAAIRRLVARENSQPDGRSMVVTTRLVTGPASEQAAIGGQSLALSVELPAAADLARFGHAGGGFPAHQADSNSAGPTGSGSGRCSGTEGKPDTPAVSAHATPLRLNPDAMIPAPPELIRRDGHPRIATDRAHTGGAFPHTPARSADRSAEAEPSIDAANRPQASLVPASALDLSAPPAGRSGASLLDVDASNASGAPRDSTAPRADTRPTPLMAPRECGSETIHSSSRETDMQAHANSTVSPLQAHSAAPFAAEAASAAQPPQAEDDNPLRLLLREIVRDEFEGELQRRLDDDLRRMVRNEIAAALTEALTRRPRS